MDFGHLWGRQTASDSRAFSAATEATGEPFPGHQRQSGLGSTVPSALLSPVSCFEAIHVFDSQLSRKQQLSIK